MTRNQRATLRWTAVLLLLLLAFGMPAGAQEPVAAESDQSQPAEPTRSVAASGIEEIVVTAQKRAQDIQDVPISMSALTSDFVEDAGLTSFDGLQQYVPNLSVIPATDSRSTAIRIRGIGATGNNAGIDPSVGVFVDGVYQGRTGLVAVADLSDIERIEVLRGPQGTLYGKNTAAGALSIVTRKPSLDRVEAFVEGLYGNFVNKELRGSVNVPVIEDFMALRLSGYWVTRDPFDRNLADDLGRNDANRSGFRAKTLMDISEDLEAMVWFEYGTQSNRCCAADVITFDGAPSLDVTFRGIADSLGEELPEADPFDRVLEADEITTNDTEVFSAAGELNYELGDHLITSLTAYRRFKSLSVLDGDFSRFNAVFNETAETFQQASSELRLTSPGGEDLEYVVGLYFYYQKDVTRGATGIGPDFFGASSLGDALSGNTDENGRVANRDTNTHETWSYAFFGQGTYRWSEQIALTLGIRGTYEKKRRVGSQISDFKAVDAGPFGPDIYYGLPCVMDPSSPVEPVCQGAEQFDVFNVSPMVSLQYFPTEDSMAFIRFARGFKSGGFNQLRTFMAVNTQFDDEISTDLEGGIRTSWLDRRLTFNATFFYTWYEDFQSQVFDGNSFLVTNAGSLRSYGIEGDLVLAPHPALVIGSSFGWNKARYSDFDAAPCTAQQDFDLNADSPAVRTRNCTQDLTGRRLDNAPEWTVSTYAQLTLPVPTGELLETPMFGYLRGEYSFRDHVFLQQDLDPGLQQPAVNLVNLRAGLRSENGRFELVGWAKNLTNERYNVVGFDIPILSGFAGVNGPRRQYGVTLRVRF